MEQSSSTKPDVGLMQYYTELNESRETMNFKGRTQCRELPLCAGLGKSVSGKHYPRLCNTRRPRLEPGTFWSQAVRLYRLHQARPSACVHYRKKIYVHWDPV